MPRGVHPREYPAWQTYIDGLRAAMAQRRERVAELIGAGLDPGQVAVLVGVARQTVVDDLHALGIPVRNIATDRAAERIEKVAELTRQGLTAVQIAEKLKVTQRTVVRDRKAAGVAGPEPNWFTAQEIEVAERLLDDGASFSEVARTLGRHPHSVASRFPGRGWSKQQTAEWMAIWRLEQSCG